MHTLQSGVHCDIDRRSAAAQVDREQVSGAVNLVFAGRPLTNAYRNLTNVVLRIAPRAAAADAMAVLVNSHFDSVFGTRGAPALVAWHGLMPLSTRQVIPHTDTAWLTRAADLTLVTSANQEHSLGACGGPAQRRARSLHQRRCLKR